MVRIILICFFCSLALLTKAQYPITQNLGSATTLVNVPYPGSLRGGLIISTFVDTGAANATNIRFYAGALIYSSSDSSIYFHTLNKWVQLLPTGGALGQTAWLVNGNTAFASTIPPWLGSVGPSSVGFRTNSTIRYTIPASGIINNNGAGVKILGVDTSDATRPLVFTAGGGGGSTNSNIGTGFRWAVPNTNNIKTTFNSFAFNWDSTSHANGLTAILDTLLLATIFHSDSVAANVPISALRPALMDNSILNGSYHQEWNWENLASQGGNALALKASGAIDGGVTRTLLDILDDDLVACDEEDHNKKGISSVMSGTNQTFLGGHSFSTYGGYFRAITNDGASNQNNYGIYADASNGFTNYAAWLNGTVKISDGTQGLGKVFKSDANGVGHWADTTIVSTNPSDSIYGNVVNTSFPGTSLPATTAGTGTFSVNNGVTLSTATTNYYDNYIKAIPPSASNNFYVVGEFTLTTAPSASTEGLYFGRMSDNSYGRTSLVARITYVDASNWTIGLYQVNGFTSASLIASTPVFCPASIAMTVGAKYRVQLSFNNPKVYVRFSRIDPTKLPNQDEIESLFIPYTYSTIIGSVLMPNTGSYSFGVIGSTSTGVYKITQFRATLFEFKNPYMLFIGNSISQGYNSSTPANNFTNFSMQNSNKKYAVNAGQGDRIDEVLLRFQEIKNFNPQYATVELGWNDIGASTGSAQFSINLSNLLDSLISNNITPIVLQLPQIGFGYDTAFANVCNRKKVRRVDVDGYLIGTLDAFDIHPNDEGMGRIVQLLKQQCDSIFTFANNYALVPAAIGGSITTSQVAYGGSVANTITGSNNYTYNGSTLSLNGSITGTAQTKVISVNEAASTGAVNLSHFNTAQAAARSTMLFSNNSSGDWVNNYSLLATNGASFASNFYFNNISGKTSDAGYTFLVNGGAQGTGMGIGTTTNTSLYLGTNNSSRLIIDGSGNIGIGGIPSEILDVTGNIKLSGYFETIPDYQTPATGATITTIKTSTIIDPAGTLATLTINLPSSPPDGMIVAYSFSQIITALTFANGTLANPITASAAGGTVKFIYSTTGGKWYKWQ